MTDSPSQRAGRWWLVLLILLVVGTYFPVIQAEFLRWDDTSTVALNPDLSPPTVHGILRYWISPHNDIYIPLTYSIWGFLASVAGTSSPGEAGTMLNSYLFHAANLLVHLGSATLVFLILHKLFTKPVIAFLAAGLYAVHPVQVETVAWVSGMKDLLCGLFLLLAIYLHLLSCDEPSGWRKLWGAGVYLAFVLALLSKPAGIVLPFILLALDTLLLHRPLRSTLRTAGSLAVLAVPFAITAVIAQPASVVPEHAPLWSRPLIAADALAFYFGKLLWPVQLCVDYGRSPAWLLGPGRTALWTTWPIPLTLLLLTLRSRKRFPAALSALAVFVAALLPVLGLITFDFQYYSTVADHYLYTAMLAVALLIGALLARFTSLWLRLGFGLLLVILAIRSCFQATYWQDTPTLFAHVIEVNPTSVAGNTNLANYLYEQGHAPEAEVYYRRALQTRPADPDALNGLGNAQTAMNQIAAAVATYQQAIHVAPDRAKLYFDLGNARMKGSQLTQAQQAFADAIARDPNYAEAWTNLGAVYLKQGNPAKALECFATAVRIDPKLKPAQLGLAAAETALHSPAIP